VHGVRFALCRMLNHVGAETGVGQIERSDEEGEKLNENIVPVSAQSVQDVHRRRRPEEHLPRRALFLAAAHPEAADIDGIVGAETGVGQIERSDEEGEKLNENIVPVSAQSMTPAPT
jgi:hypothetical protein